MSHQGRGRGRATPYNGGRGRGKGGYNNNFENKTNNKHKEAELKFNPYGSGYGKTTATYDTVKDHILQTVQKSFKNSEDIVTSLRDGMKIDLSQQIPQLGMAEDENEDKRKVMQKALELRYQVDYAQYSERLMILENNLMKAYALIFRDYCSKIMQNRIEQHHNFESEIRDNPIKLLEVIKVLIHDTVRGKYPFGQVTDSIRNFVLTKQMDNESLLDYAKRFKENRDVLKSQIGTNLLDEFAESTAEYKATSSSLEKQNLKACAFNRWAAYILIKNSDMSKYGSLLNGMATQYAMGHNQFPKDVQKAVDIMSNHRFDNQKESPRKKFENDKKENEDKVKKESSFAQSTEKMICYVCGKKGHGANKCSERETRKKEDWHINKQKGANHNQQGASANESERKKNELDENSTGSSDDKRKGWSGLQVNLFGKKEKLKETNLKDLKQGSIILDNGSTLSIFGSPDMVTDIRESNVTLELSTNAGTREINKIANVPGFGTVWFDDEAIANIFGLSDLKMKHRVTYDSEKGDKFIVHMEHGNIEFICNPEGLYEYKVSDLYLNEVKSDKTQGQSHIIETVRENRVGFTDRQYNRAKIARELYHNVGSPTVDNFKALLKMNMIKNCPVTIEDVNVAEKIFGPAMSTLKGKSTRQAPRPVIRDEIELPDEINNMDHNLDLCMDIMFINELPMLTTIDRTIRFRGLVPLESRTHAECYDALDKILRFYN